MDLATGAMGSLLLKLGDLLTEEYELQSGVREDIQYLKRELTSMYAALRKIGDVPRDQLDPQVKLWADDVRDLSYRMEDVIDKFLVRVEGYDASSSAAAKPRKLKRLMKKMGALLVKGKARHDIGDEIKGIKTRVQEACDRRDRYRVNEAVENSVGATTVDPRLLVLYKDRKELIGIDGSIKRLTKMLTDEVGDVSKQLKILSIFGFGGLGKTTLAKAVYDKLRTQFDCSAFVPVGRNPSVKKLLMDILFEIDKHMYQDSNISMLDERQLIDKLRILLDNKRYFIVIDDIWDTGTWEIIRCALEHNSCASIIITTTRILEVAAKTGEVYRLEPLSHDLSMELFNTRLFGGKSKCPYDQPPEVYNKILRKCGGVPLAITTIASLLVGKPVEVWSKVYNSIGFGYEDNRDVDNTRKILLFSYYDLPCHLRTCLLYLSIYPEDRVIGKDSMIWKWAAEGFVHDEQGVGLSEIGEMYFNELVNKSMILPVEATHEGIITGCLVHDMVLDMICLLSKEENFVTLLDSNEQLTSSHSNARRLAVGRRYKPLDNKCMPQVRSFIVTCKTGTVPSLSCFQVLRVLALEGIDCHYKSSHLEHLGKLVHLRYLGLMSMDIPELPKDLGNLKFLQTLQLHCGRLRELPESVGQLSQLKYLRMYTYIRVPDWIGKLTSLEQLQIYEVSRSSNFVHELGKLTELRKLSIARPLHLSRVSSVKAWAESLVKLQKIQSIDISQIFSVRCDDSVCCWERYVPPRHLRVLHMPYRQPGLLARINPLLLPNLSHLSVHVDSPDLEIFGRFPELVTLRLKMEGILHHDVMGGAGAFPKLRVFRTDATPSRFLEGDMPSLESLSIHIDLAAGSNIQFDFGSLVNLPMLQQVTAKIWYSYRADLRKAEKDARHTINMLPNPPILHISSYPKLDLQACSLRTRAKLS